MLDLYEPTLANRETAHYMVYEDRIEWHGRHRRVTADEAGSDPLLGMNLLWRNRITIDVYANGPVTIKELG